MNITVRNILFIVFLITSFPVFSQQLQGLIPLETDSVQLELDRQREYRQLLSGSAENSLLIGQPALPGFNEQFEFNKRYSFHFDFNAFNGQTFSGFSTGSGIPLYSPFYRNGMVLSEASYQLGNRFVLGGFSYGANSLFSAPFPNQGLNRFDSYGSTLFMQYKVSKNFKIETRVNVSQGNHPGF